MSFTGRWEIESMEVWGREYIDLLERGHFEVSANGTGSFVFGNLRGGIHGQARDDDRVFEFSWEAMEDRGDIRSGRGRLEIGADSATCTGVFAIHMGDVSKMVLKRA
ncbi:MAG: hypothetical protein AAGI88_13825 [Pseudomonadota bacterium]